MSSRVAVHLASSTSHLRLILQTSCSDTVSSLFSQGGGGVGGGLWFLITNVTDEPNSVSVVISLIYIDILGV